MEQDQIEASIVLGAWYERFKDHRPAMPELEAVFVAVEQLLGSQSLSLLASGRAPTAARSRMKANDARKAKVLAVAAQHPDAKPYEICTLAHIAPSNWRWVEQILIEAEEASA